MKAEHPFRENKKIKKELKMLQIIYKKYYEIKATYLNI